MLPLTSPKPNALEPGWFAAWTAAQMITGIEPVINPHLIGKTVRQQLRPSIGGHRIRLTLSNEYGTEPLQLETVHIARLIEAGRNAIDTSTDTVLTFGGAEHMELPAGKRIVSDEIDFHFEALQDLAITIKIGASAGGQTTGHNDALSSIWIGEGNVASEETFPAMMATVNWYFITELDVRAQEHTETLVLIGDSITDCYGARDNRYERWSDVLSRLLRNHPETSHISVVNEGIGGNAIFGGLGPALKDRFDRDVLQVPGVKRVVVLIGINDIGFAQRDISADMIKEYHIMIDKCHARGIRIYAGTIMPVGGHGYYSALHEQIRTTINEWFLSGQAKIDGVIDFAGATADPTDPSRLFPDYTADLLHCNTAGYQRMGEYAYERLLDLWRKEANA